MAPDSNQNEASPKRENAPRKGPPPLPWNKTPLDGGWGWLVVLGGIIATLQWGFMLRAFGMIYLGMLDYYRSTPAMVSWVGALSMSFSGLMGPVSGALTRKFGFKKVAMTGGVLSFVSMILSGFSQSVELCYLTYGVIGGFACSLSLTPVYSVVGVYFRKKRATAMAVMSLGNDLSIFIAPPLIEHVFSEYGYRGGMCILGAIFLHTCVGASLFRPIEDNYSKRPPALEMTEVVRSSQHDISQVTANQSGDGDEPREVNNDEVDNDIEASKSEIDESAQPLAGEPEVRETKSKCGTCLDKFKTAFDLEILRSSRFLAFCFMHFSVLSHLAVTSLAVPALAVDWGYTFLEGAFVLSAAGFSGIAALPAGACLDFKIIQKIKIYWYASFAVLLGISGILTPLSVNYTGLLITSLVRGFTGTVLQSQRATLCADIVGIEKVPNAFGMLLFFQSIGALIGRAATGAIRESLGSYDVAFYYTGALLVLASSFFMVVNLKGTKREQIRR